MRSRKSEPVDEPPAEKPRVLHLKCSYCTEYACSEVTWPDRTVNHLCGRHERWLLGAQLELDGLLELV